MKTNLFHLCALTLATHALQCKMHSCNIIVYHVSKCISCHKDIVVITRRRKDLKLYTYETRVCGYIYIYIYIYINQELSQWDYPILRPERDSQDQELFLAPSTDKQISNYDRVLKPLSIPITIKHQDWAAACSRIHMFVWQNMLNQILRSSIVRIPPSPPPHPF